LDSEIAFAQLKSEVDAWVEQVLPDSYLEIPGKKRRGTERQFIDAMGCPWVSTSCGLECIPPIYTEYIGKSLMEVIMKNPKAQKPLTKAEFENLLQKSAQPLEPGPKPLPEVEQTSESQSSGDCTETHTH